MSQEPEIILPWYKQFWAWFIFTPLIVVVLACSVMVTIAFKTKEDVVTDDYYKVGRMINQAFEPAQNAKALGLLAEIRFLNEGRIVSVNLNESDWTVQDTLLLNISHPVDADKDHFITLKRNDALMWQAEMKVPMEGRWYFRLSSIDDAGGEEWRLQEEIDLATETSKVFKVH